MPQSKRFEALAKRPVNQDGFLQEWPEAGIIAMDSPYDPEPSLKIENGVITEMDGKSRAEFDFIDSFIADHAIDLTVAEEAMGMDDLALARQLVDIHVDKSPIKRLVGGMTPAKLCKVPVSYTHLDVYKRQRWSRGG